MSRTARKLKQVEASAENAVKMPQAEPERYALNTSQRLAVNNIASRRQSFEQFQAQFMQVQRDLVSDEAALIAELEKAFDLPAGSIGREYAVINGEVVKQSKG